MKVLDLRPWPIRMALALWGRERGDFKEPARAPGPFCPASWYGGLVDRIMARRAQARPVAPPVRPFLLSVGNLALGGTGKTPVVGALARDLSARGLRGAILTRGFGSDLTGPLVVDSTTRRAGDEARWHAARLADSDWTVVQARSRPEGLGFLMDLRPGLDVVLLEDAHQTAGLPRHLDLVILDRWSRPDTVGSDLLDPGTGPVFPFGPYRESVIGSLRAGVFLVEAEGDVPGKSTSGIPVEGFRRKVSMRDPRGSETTRPNSASWVALSGIAHPGAFENAAAKALGSSPVVAIRHSDHVDYTASRVDRIRREMEASGAGLLVTTAKDWVKLAELWPAELPCLVADLEIEWRNGNALLELIEERVESLPRG